MDLTEIIDNIFHLNFPTQFQLASTFLRFQEHYESPEFRGKIFTLDEFKRWYTANSEKGKETGNFTYYEDWTGFNVPSYTLEPFYDESFNPLSDQEKMFLDLFANRKCAKFYVIGTFGGGMEALGHEIAHGLFYTNKDYREQVLHILGKINSDEIKIIHSYLLKIGYCEEVLDDETQAYLVDDIGWFKENGVEGESFIKIHDQLREVFDKYIAGSKITSFTQ